MLFLSHRILLIIKIAFSYAASYFKRKYYLQVHRYIKDLEKATLFDADLIITFIIKNIICFTLKVKNITTLVKRFSMICIINLVPLALRKHINIITN